MTEELEKIGVDVWIAGTIYVDAETDEEARKIVSERYAGTREQPETYDHMSGEDLPLDGDDFQSSAVTFYGLCRDSELFPTVDPVRDAAPEMLAALKEAQDWLVGMIDSNDLHDDDRACLERIDAAIAKAEGAK